MKLNDAVRITKLEGEVDALLDIKEELEAENTKLKWINNHQIFQIEKLREALEIHNNAIDEIWKAVDYDQRLEEMVEDAWVKYKEVMKDV